MKYLVVGLLLLLTTAWAWAGTLVYDFSHKDQFEDWRFETRGLRGDPTLARWAVVNGKLVALSRGVCDWATGPFIGDETWTNYEFEYQFNKGMLQIPQAPPPYG